MAEEKVVIIGAGFGGLIAAKHLKKSSKQVLLIDKTNHHLFQPLLYQVATAGLSAVDIATPIRQVFSTQQNVTVIMAQAERIAPDTRQVYLEDGTAVDYDYLIVAVGVVPSFFGHDEWHLYAQGLKTIDDALNIRDRLLMCYEKAETLNDPALILKHLTFVVIGGGPTGVEISGALAEIANKTLIRNFRRIDPSSTKIYLIEGSNRLLNDFSPRISSKTQAYLNKLGVTVMLGQEVTGIDGRGVRIGDCMIESANVIWAAGSKAPALLNTLGAECDQMGRVIVGPDLSVPGHEEIFVIGDAALVRRADESPLPGIAPVAVQQARHVARIIRHDIPRQKRRPFRYKDRGMLATIGKSLAVAKFGSIEFSGFMAWLLWSFIHIFYLILFKSRIMVFLQWTVWYITGQRGARLIRVPDKHEKK